MDKTTIVEHDADLAKNNTLVYMQRAIELAEQARGKCSPNPFVGAVIVKDGRIIGSGFTQKYGSDHAEVQAIKNSTESCTGADIYVTLEPCSHYGKTPPCAKTIIESGISKVYYGISDPNPLVAGKGRQMLLDAGIEVEHGFCADVITQQLEYYLTYITKQRPFVFLKSGVTLDGRIAAKDGTSRWISCEESRTMTHELRMEADALITGIGTVKKDNPLLNVRLPKPYKQPVRIILDSKLSIPLISQIVATATEQETLIFMSAGHSNPAKEKALAELGLEIIKIPSAVEQDADPAQTRTPTVEQDAVPAQTKSPAKHSPAYLDLNLVLTELYNRKISVVMVEAGSRVNTSFLKAGLVDKLYMFIAPKLLGGDHFAWHDIGIENIEQALNLRDMQTKQVGADTLFTGYLN